jgi:leucyl-tRNA synthetase
MFAYRWQEGGQWNSTGIEGIVRWLRRTWTLYAAEGERLTGVPSLRGPLSVVDGVRRSLPSGQSNPTDAASAEVLRSLRRKLHQTLQHVTRDFEAFEFNTIISSLMELLNEVYKAREAGASGTPEWDEVTESYLKMLAPVCPHLAEELWTVQLGKPYSVHQQGWPKVDQAAAMEDVIEVPVQVNGKVRDRVIVPADASEEVIKAAALASEVVRKYMEGKEPRKIIVAQRRLVSIVM